LNSQFHFYKFPKLSTNLKGDFMKSLLLVIALFSSSVFAEQNMSLGTSSSVEFKTEATIASFPTDYNSYFDWGTGRNGYGYCYEWTNDGRVLNSGAAQPNYLCEQYRPSRFDWGRGQNGYGYCYQYTPYNIPMNEGRAQNNYSCEVYRPSYYAWGRGRDGYTYCYQYTPGGLPMNEGRAQDNAFCR
jgi:hypothetical protein